MFVIALKNQKQLFGYVWLLVTHGTQPPLYFVALKLCHLCSWHMICGVYANYRALLFLDTSTKSSQTTREKLCCEDQMIWSKAPEKLWSGSGWVRLFVQLLYIRFVEISKLTYLFSNKTTSKRMSWVFLSCNSFVVVLQINGSCDCVLHIETCLESI